MKKLGQLSAIAVFSASLFAPVSPAIATADCNPTVTTAEISGASYQVAVFPVGTCTWTIPQGVESVDVLVVGGGGGGGGGAGDFDATTAVNGAGGAGGGGGQVTIENDILVSFGLSATITVGEGGLNGLGGVVAADGTNGDPGDDSSFAIQDGPPIHALGGLGGQGGVGPTSAGDGGASGSGFLGGLASGPQAGSGASATADGSASQDSTPGLSSDFTGTTVTYASGGGGGVGGDGTNAWSSDRIPNGPESEIGKGSGGGRGAFADGSYGYGRGAGGTTKAGDGTVIVRWLSVKSDAPTDLAASFEGQDVVLTWTAPVFEGSRAVTGYRVEVNDGTGWNPLTSPVTNTTDTTYTASGLDPAGTFQFRIYAYSSISFVYSVASEVFELAPEAPAAPAPYLSLIHI